MSVKTFGSEILTSGDVNTYLANSGLVYVKSQTVGAGVTGVTVSSAFSSTYDNYFISWQGGSMSGDTAMMLRLGSTVSGYYGAFIHTPNYAGTTVQNAGDINSAQFTYFGGGNSTQAGGTCYLSNPALMARTFITGGQVSYGNTFGTYTGVEISSTAHTSFTLFPFSGTMTGGTITVYGYRKA